MSREREIFRLDFRFDNDEWLITVGSDVSEKKSLPSNGVIESIEPRSPNSYTVYFSDGIEMLIFEPIAEFSRSKKGESTDGKTQ